VSGPVAAKALGVLVERLGGEVEIRGTEMENIKFHELHFAFPERNEHVLVIRSESKRMRIRRFAELLRKGEVA
jgi:hypothetical protein